MPNRDPMPQPDADGPRGPTTTPGLPDRSQEESPVPPIIKPQDDINPNDPPLPFDTVPDLGPATI